MEIWSLCRPNTRSQTLQWLVCIRQERRKMIVPMDPNEIWYCIGNATSLQLYSDKEDYHTNMPFLFPILMYCAISIFNNKQNNKISHNITTKCKYFHFAVSSHSFSVCINCKPLVLAC